MAWCLSGAKPLSEPVVVRLPTHIWETRPQWVKSIIKVPDIHFILVTQSSAIHYILIDCYLLYEVHVEYMRYRNVPLVCKWPTLQFYVSPRAWLIRFLWHIPLVSGVRRGSFICETLNCFSSNEGRLHSQFWCPMFFLCVCFFSVLNQLLWKELKLIKCDKNDINKKFISFHGKPLFVTICTARLFRVGLSKGFLFFKFQTFPENGSYCWQI